MGSRQPQRPKSDDLLGRIRYLTTQFDDTRGSRVQIQYENGAPHRVERVTSEDGESALVGAVKTARDMAGLAATAFIAHRVYRYFGVIGAEEG